MTKKPFTPRPEKSTKLLEIVHSDLCQPSNAKSEGGNMYFVTFIDDYSGWCELYLLKSKDQVFQAFKEYKNFAERQTGKKIKNLQSDNGREYCNKTFDDYMRQEGIQRRLTTPYTPQQNGVAERMNRTIVEMARCLLIQSGLPTMYWGEAIQTANYLRNRSPSRSHQGMTPYEKWIGNIPLLRHLRVFGSKAFILDKGPGRRKLDDKGIEGKLVGYSRTAKAYRIRRNDTGKIVETRDVQIIEENTLASRETIPVDIDYTHPHEETQEPGRVTKNERPCEEHVMRPPVRRGPGRPAKGKTGKPGRPPKIYRFASVSSIASSQASSRENLYEDETPEIERKDEQLDDVFKQAIDNENRPLDTSLFPEGKRLRQDAHSDHEKSPMHQEAEERHEQEFMETEYAEEMAMTADIDLEEAINGAESLLWKRALIEEVRSHLEHGTWELVKRPTNTNVIDSKVILKNKLTADGKLEQKKARIVARGFTQRPGFDYDETFAPVVRLESIRLLATLAAGMKSKIYQCDVITAYLNAELDDELYMEIPMNLKEILQEIIRREPRDSEIQERAVKMLQSLMKENQVCKLLKSLYGLKQSGKKWYNKLCKIFAKLGLKPTISDPCLFIRREGDDILIVGVHVDDALATSSNPRIINDFKKALNRELKIKDLGEARYCLGIEFKQEVGRIGLNQRRYVEEIMAKFGMTGCTPNRTPASPTSKLKASTDPNKPTKNPQYRELVGSLMYLAVATRPDIAHSVSVLSQYNEKPTEEHWGAAKRVLRYLNGTPNKEMVYNGKVEKLIGYVDAGWRSDEDDSRSYGGYAFILGGAAISWKSRKQPSVGLSTTESEFRALTEATKESIYLRGLLSELGLSQLSDGLIYCDNLGAVRLTTSMGHHEHTKHARMYFHFVRECVAERKIHVVHLQTEKMIADIFTKSLPKDRHEGLTRALGMSDMQQ